MTTQTEALKLALEAFTIVRFCVPPAQRPTIERAITTTIEALSELEQDDEVLGFNGWGFPIEKPSQPEQEPVAWEISGKLTALREVQAFVDKQVREVEDILRNIAYTNPPQRTWVGLTDEEQRAIVTNNRSSSGAMMDTIAKLKEKNT